MRKISYGKQIDVLKGGTKTLKRVNCMILEASFKQMYEGVTGLLVTPKDTKELEKAILQLCNSNALREGMGEKGRKRVEALFSLKQCADKHYELYHNITRGDRLVMNQSGGR